MTATRQPGAQSGHRRRGARVLLPAGAVGVMAAGLLTAGAVTVPAGGGSGSVTAAPVAAQAADPLAARVRTLQDELRRARRNTWPGRSSGRRTSSRPG